MNKSPLELIKENTTFFAMIPWNGVPIPCELYMLNAVQIKSCGDFNVIDIEHAKEKDGKDEPPDIDDIIRIENAQEKLMEFALVHPTFEEISDYLNQTETMERVKREIARIEKVLKDEPDSEDKKALEQELEACKMFIGLAFPDDFRAVLTSIILQRDNTDIRRVTRDMLLEAGFLAERWKDTPAEHISGVFTDFQRDNINKLAAIVVGEYREMKEIENKTGKKWYRGGRS